MFRFQPLNFGTIYCNLTFSHGICSPRPQFFVWTFFKICPFLTRLQMCPRKTFSETSRHRWYSKAGSNKYWCFTRVWRLKIQGENFPTLFKRPWHKSIIFCWVPTTPPQQLVLRVFPLRSRRYRFWTSGLDQSSSKLVGFGGRRVSHGGGPWTGGPRFTH